VVLAEYAHLRGARRANNDQSTARYNFFLVVASGATAVAGGLITGGGSGAANTSGVIGIGALVLLLGLTVFVRGWSSTSAAAPRPSSTRIGAKVDEWHAAACTVPAQRTPDTSPTGESSRPRDDGGAPLGA
jgi:hypothetical protein